MTSSLEDLLGRSMALGGRLGVDEALEINQAILELDPENEIAGTRLGIGLLSAERAKEAVPVLEAALRAHPGNAFAAKRLEQAQRDIVRGALPAPRKRNGSSAAALGVWVKAIHHDEGWTVAPGELSWVSDAGIIDRHGDRMYRDDGQPAGEPSWRVGDPIGLYFASTKRIPLLAEVAQRPSFDPAFIVKEGGTEEDAERWPWVTMIRGITALPLENAPTLEDLEIASRSIQQRTRKLLDEAQGKLLLRFLKPA